MARFGTTGVSLGYLTLDQVLHALRLQDAEDGARLPHRYMGEICRDLGYLTEEQREEILREQGFLTVALACSRRRLMSLSAVPCN